MAENNLQKLREELKKLQSRQTELSAQHQEAVTSLNTERTALVEGSGSAETLIATQSAATALEGACSEIAQRIQAKAAELDQAIVNEQRALQLAQLAQIGVSIHDDMAELDKVSAEAMKALNASVIDAAARFEIIAGQQIEYSNLHRQIGNVPERLNAANGQTIQVRQLLNLSISELLGRVEQETLKKEAKPFGDFFRIALLDSFTRRQLQIKGRAAGERAEQSIRDEREFQQYQQEKAEQARRDLENGQAPQN